MFRNSPKKIRKGGKSRSLSLDRHLLFQEWFENIYHVNFESLYRYAFAITKDKQLAEDVVSEIFSDLWHKKPDFENILEPLAYLRVAVKHLAIRHISKNPQTFNASDYLESLQISDGIDPENLLLGVELDRFINDVLDALPAHNRLVYELARKKGLTNQEISEQLGISIRTVETHLYQVMKKLKDALQKYFDAAGDSSTMFIIKTLISIVSVPGASLIIKEVFEQI